MEMLSRPQPVREQQPARWSSDPVVVGLGEKVTANHDPAENADRRDCSVDIDDSRASESPAAAETGSIVAAGRGSRGSQSRAPEPAAAGSKLRPRRRRRVRMRYLMQAWTVSLLVHVVILSALAAATFSAKEAVNKILNFDSALAGFRNGEPEPLADLRRPG